MRLVTIADIISRARTHADQRNSQFVSDTEALALFNEIWPELYDELIDIDENYYVTDAAPITISSAASSYALPADFYKIVGVDYAASVGASRMTLYRYNEADRNLAFTSTTNIPNGVIYVRYVPAPSVFTSTTQSVDGVSGWDRLCSLRLAIDMLDAEETNSDRVARKYQERLETMRGSLERDIGMPATVSDVSRPAQFIPSSLQYRLYQNNINLISTELLSGGAFF